MNAPLQTHPTTQLSMAKNIADRTAAFKLTHRAYVDAGLGVPSQSGMRVTPYQLLPESRIFVGKVEQEVVVTVSLIPDSDKGLPMESIYPQEIEQLRNKGLWVAEVGCLADRRMEPRRFIDTFCSLTKLMAQYSRTRGIDGFVIAIHPRHAKYYKSFLCFEEIGGVVSYPLVSNRPAVALFLGFEAARMNSPLQFGEFFDRQYDEEAKEWVHSGAMSENEVEYFRQFVDLPMPSLANGYSLPDIALAR